MDRVPSHPVLDCAQAQAWEKALLADEAAEWDAMQRAGAGVAAEVLADFAEIGGFPASGQVLVLVGKGHNGGDALLAARAILLAHPHARVVVLPCLGASALQLLARRALEALASDAAGRMKIATVDEVVGGAQVRYALCLDGIFGFQFRPPMEPALRELVEALNARPGIALRAAVDLPSGVGEGSTPTALRADFTYATGIVKRPVLSATAASAVGRLRYVDLGFFDAGEPEATAERVLLRSILSPLAELRPARTDKRTYGHLLVVGGSRNYPGAVMLAVRAALRSGVGLVTALVPASLAPEFAARQPEAMWVGCPESPTGALAAGADAIARERTGRATAILIGPGLGSAPETIAWAARLATASTVPLVLDADALRAEVVAGVLDKAFICTPHAGEFERIAPRLFEGARLTSPRGVLVLKGPMTRVTDGSTIYHSPFGGPVLARGGSGDILAGLVGGLLAQEPERALLAACRGVVWHGRAADLLARARGQVAVEISEILEQLGPALTP